MALEIFWSKRADKKFDSITSYLFREWDEKVTSGFIRHVHKLIEIISEFPEIGTLEHKEKNIRGFLVTRQISLFYKVRGKKLIILNFFDNRQNPRSKNF